MAYYRPSPKGILCNYPVAMVLARHLVAKGKFDPSVLEEAKGCGTKVMVNLVDKTENILGENGGLDLKKFDQRISFFRGKIDPYAQNGVIIGHGVVDEPHDCNDWKGVCPKASEVDQASAISKRYWPTLPTGVNTIPPYIIKEGYTWTHTDIIIFQYAYHKGDLKKFVATAVDLRNQGRFRDLAWALQVKSGGCPRNRDCSMSPDQVRTVAGTMCNASPARAIGFVFYELPLITAEMQRAIGDVQRACSK